MEPINIVCNDGETITYSKRRIDKFCAGLVQGQKQVPFSKDEVLIFLGYIDCNEIPDKNEVDKLYKLLDVADYAGLSDDIVPGRFHLVDLIYEKLEEGLNFRYGYKEKMCCSRYGYKYGKCKEAVSFFNQSTTN